MAREKAIVNLADYSQAKLQDYFAGLGQPVFRAQQLVRWIHQRGVTDFAQMTDFSLSLRERLNQEACITFPALALARESCDGTKKWLVRVEHGDMIEMVYIPEQGRGTLCVSSQVGCALNCSFCATGKQGFNRNLTMAEIIGQVWLAKRELDKADQPLTNVVMMGMGEPLLNFDAVVDAMDLMLCDFAYGLSKYRVTLRTELVPINRHYPLKELMQVCREYFKNEPRRSIMFEYVMLDGVNDGSEHARELISLLKGMKAKLNLIPFNPFPQTSYQTSPKKRIEAFQ